MNSPIRKMLLGLSSVFYFLAPNHSTFFVSQQTIFKLVWAILYCFNRRQNRLWWLCGLRRHIAKSSSNHTLGPRFDTLGVEIRINSEYNGINASC